MTLRGYLGMVQEVRPILAGMERRGLPIDDAERLRLGAEFDAAAAELQKELDACFPDAVRSVHPKQGYKRTPKDTAGMTLRAFSTDDGLVERWCRLEPLSPNSSQQLLRYMKAKQHPVPKSREEDAEGNQKDTTGKKELQRLAKRTGDNFYLKVIEFRELVKAKGTYIDGFKPHADGCVHTTFTFDTAIGQLSSRSPNIQNFMKHVRLAKATRRMIAAKPGHILAEWDYKSCHVLTLGLLANDPNYVRCARIDMHSLVTGHKLKLWNLPRLMNESTDDELRERCRWLKSNPEWKHIRDSRMKHAILGIGNGLKKRGLYEKHMEDFGSEKEAGEFLAVAESLFPKVFEYHARIQRRAHDQRVLKTDYGFLRRFYEVYRWDWKGGRWTHGDQQEEATSYCLSNIAFGYIREHMKLLAAAGLDERYGLCNNVHDSLLFHFREELLAEHVREMYPVLVKPSAVLRHPEIAPEGLVIDAECNAGQNWSDMHEINIKDYLYDEHQRAHEAAARPPEGSSADALSAPVNA